MEDCASDIRQHISTEVVEEKFNWILDPSFTRPQENLYTRTIEVNWNLKTILGMAMQDNTQSWKVLQEKVDRLNDKFTVYVESVHHRKFITKDSPMSEWFKAICSKKQNGDRTSPPPSQGNQHQEDPQASGSPAEPIPVGDYQPLFLPPQQFLGLNFCFCNPA